MCRATSPPRILWLRGIGMRPYRSLPLPKTRNFCPQSGPTLLCADSTERASGMWRHENASQSVAGS